MRHSLHRLISSAGINGDYALDTRQEVIRLDTALLHVRQRLERHNQVSSDDEEDLRRFMELMTKIEEQLLRINHSAGPST